MQQSVLWSGCAALAVCLVFLSRFVLARTQSGPMSISVKWGAERFTLALPSPDTKLAHLRAALAEKTSLEPATFKIVHAGAVMKDENAPISVYGIRNRSTIAVVGKKDAPTAAAAPAEKPTEASTIQRIQTELQAVRTTLVPPLDAFLESATSRAPAATAAEHKRLDELLLQCLLKLDAISPDGTWEDARRERKVAVREVQSHLDRLDKGWKALPS
ncbi:hypothetical protein BKA62DRAFT_682590 [Auriculariales sp. MPI-PUGE-AT-0066]|nr:hypothetical protein BKA62DRAFT_682590 [Auriculariales sp. MPI-PUGE-AT-0066]